MQCIIEKEIQSSEEKNRLLMLLHKEQSNYIDNQKSFRIQFITIIVVLSCFISFSYMFTFPIIANIIVLSSSLLWCIFKVFESKKWKERHENILSGIKKHLL